MAAEFPVRVAEHVEVSIDGRGQVVIETLEFFDGMSPDEAFALADVITDAAREARQVYDRRQRTDAVRDLLDAIDADPGFALAHRVHIGYKPGFGQIYDSGEYARIRSFLIASFPNGDIKESTRLASDDKAVWREFEITTKRGATLFLEAYDSDPVGIAAAQRERDGAVAS